MTIELNKKVAEDLTVREGLLMSLGSSFLNGESRVLKELANLRERLVDSKGGAFYISVAELKYCTNAILFSDYDKRTKSALIGALDA